MTTVWITALLFFCLYLFWYEAHTSIVSWVFRLNILEAKLVMLVFKPANLTNDIILMQSLDPSLVTWSQLLLFSKHVGDYIRYPLMLIIVIFAWILHKSDVTLRFRKTYDMKKLSTQEQVNWPSIMPVVTQDLVSADIDIGPWAMALTPIEFARKNDLLKKNDVLLDKSLPGQEKTASIRRGDAKRVFTLQLGPLWNGFTRCPPHGLALAAVFMARMNRDKDSAAAILTDLDKNFTTGNCNYSLINKVINKYQNEMIVQEVLVQHAYFLTVMASLLMASRDDGVVPASEFLWLKPVDRRLWYMLNSVGRQTPFAEVGGPFAHWCAEKKMRRKFLAPMIDEAIKALEIAVKEIQLSDKELSELKP